MDDGLLKSVSLAPKLITFASMYTVCVIFLLSEMGDKMFHASFCFWFLGFMQINQEKTDFLKWKWVKEGTDFFLQKTNYNQVQTCLFSCLGL